VAGYKDKSVPEIGKERADLYWMDAKDRAHLTHWGRRPSVRERSRETLLRQWYGETEGNAEIAARRSPPVHIGRVVGSVMRDLGLSRNVLLEELLDSWSAVVGDDVARRSVPSDIQGATLTVEVSDSSWMYMLQTVHRQRIVDELRRISDNKLRDIRFVPHGRIRRTNQ